MPVVALFHTFMTIGITLFLLIFYNKKKLNIIDICLISYSAQGYSLSYIGPTITPYFFISIYFLFEFVFKFISGKSIVVKKKYIYIIILPLISSIWAILYHTFSQVSFYHIPVSVFYFLTKPVFFYSKNFLPLFVLGYKIYQERDVLSLPKLFRTVKIITIVSCLWAVFQILLSVTTKSPLLIDLSGNKSGYMYQLFNGITFVRVSGFFIEPKNLGAFLGISIPILLYLKEYKISLLAFVIGLLTVSQTFTVECLIAFMVFIFFKNLKNARLIIVSVLVSIIFFFVIISQIKDILITQASEYRDNVVFVLVAERLLLRYDGTLTGLPKTEVLGLPLQPDLELPIVLFLIDHPWVFLTGYGPGNSNYISPDYFIGQPNYELQLSGKRANHMNMRWIFYISEFGLIIFLCFLWVFTSFKSNKFITSLYAYLWLCLFFNEVEIYIIIVYLLVLYPPKIFNKLFIREDIYYDFVA